MAATELHRHAGAELDCACSYPQAPNPTRTVNMTPFSHNSNPWIICPYYTGRDKGPLRASDGAILTFFGPGHAWKHIFTVVQPNDDRACDNYRVEQLL